MDNLAFESAQIDRMFQEIWAELSETEQQEFLQEIWQVDQLYEREIELVIEQSRTL